MERKNICYEVPPELLHVSAGALPFLELSPRVEKILDRDDILVYKTP